MWKINGPFHFHRHICYQQYEIVSVSFSQWSLIFSIIHFCGPRTQAYEGFQSTLAWTCHKHKKNKLCSYSEQVVLICFWKYCLDNIVKQWQYDEKRANERENEGENKTSLNGMTKAFEWKSPKSPFCLLVGWLTQKWNTISFKMNARWSMKYHKIIKRCSQKLPDSLYTFIKTAS